jgi:hypothetical protein
MSILTKIKYLDQASDQLTKLVINKESNLLNPADQIYEHNSEIHQQCEEWSNEVRKMI